MWYAARVASRRTPHDPERQRDAPAGWSNGPVTTEADATSSPAAPRAGTIDLHLRPPTLGSGRHVPVVLVDGVRAEVAIGHNRLTVPPGPHTVQAAPRLAPARTRDITVDVPAGGAVRLFYADPPSRFFGGSLGTKRRQDWVLRALQVWGLVAALFLLASALRS